MRGLGDGVGLAVVPVGGGGAWTGFKPTCRAAEQRPGPTGVEGTGRTTGPGRGAGGWRQGQGGPPPTGTHSGQTELGRSCAVDGGHTEQPGLTQHAVPGTPVAPHRKQNSSNTTKNAHANAIVHSFTATLTKVI